MESSRVAVSNFKAVFYRTAFSEQESLKTSDTDNQSSRNLARVRSKFSLTVRRKSNAISPIAFISVRKNISLISIGFCHFSLKRRRYKNVRRSFPPWLDSYQRRNCAIFFRFVSTDLKEVTRRVCSNDLLAFRKTIRKDTCFRCSVRVHR